MNIRRGSNGDEISGRKVFGMKFQRIDESTIRCIVSKEDMMEYGISLEDFFKNKGKIHEFLHVVVERAEEEVGYEPRQGMLSMQIMPLTPNSISITFSEKEDTFGDAVNLLKESLEEIRKEISESGQSDTLAGLLGLDLEDIDEDDEEELFDSEDENEKTSVISENDSNIEDVTSPLQMNNTNELMITSDSIQQLAMFCKAAGMGKTTVHSNLYYLASRNSYSLLIKKDKMSARNFRHLLVLATEYSKFVTDLETSICYVEEYGELLIEKKAFRVLANQW